MEIRCHKTKRFLINVNISTYHEYLSKIKVSMDVPLRVEIPCANCRIIEVYEIYKDKYIYIKSYKFDKKKKIC